MDRSHFHEDTLAENKPVNDYYPDIERFHENELLAFFDRLNSGYVVERKRRLNGVNTGDEALAYVRRVRETFAGCLGELPAGGELRAETVRTVDRGDYRIDNVLIEALPGYFLNASFYYPREVQRPLPAILFLCGHAHNGKAYPMYVSFCVEAVLNGFCVLTFDPVGHGERRMYDSRDSEHFNGSPDAVHYLLGQQAWLVGDSITAHMMHDNIRALDYLLTRKEVDGKAVAVAGNSGGGHMAAFLGAYDGRVAAVVSSCYITELANMIHHVGAQECEQSLPGFMKRGLDLADLVIAAAPKPYFIGASLMDFFPIDGTRDAYQDARRIYRLLGSQGNLEIHIAPKPHGFWRETREHALGFLCRQFGVRYVTDKEIDYDSLPGERELNCLADGDINTRNTVSLQQMLSSKAAVAVPGLPSIGCGEELRAFIKETTDGLRSVLGFDAAAVSAETDEVACQFVRDSGLTITEYTFYSERYMKVFATLYETERGPKQSAVLYVGPLTPKDACLLELLREFPAVLTVEPRGTGRGTVEPGCYFYEPAHFENEEASLCCAAAMQGRSLAGMRVLDVLAAEKLLKSMEDYGGCRVAMAGRGEHALTALYAAVALGGRDVRLADLLYSLKSLVDNRMYLWGPAVFAPDMLRHTDIPHLLAALAGNDVKVYGLLDHMLQPVEPGVLTKLSRLLAALAAIGGGSTELR